MGSASRFKALPNRHSFFEQVWDIVRKIPRGKVTTYGGIASLLGRPRNVTARHYRAAGARWVGQAMAHSPADVPWHRVINAQGKVSRRADGDASRLQRLLLEEEGISFEKGEKIDLARYGWSIRPRRMR